MNMPRYSLLAASGLFLGLPFSGFAQTAWQVGGTDLNWSTANNWTAGLPAGTAVTFGTAGLTGSATTVGNIVDTSYTGGNALTSLTYNAASTNWQVTQIDSGQTLTVAGDFRVGQFTSGANTTKVAFTGTGSLVINNSASVVSMTNSGSTSARAIVDMSALSTFSANVNTFNVGTGTTGFGTLYLADNSTITAATSIKSGGSGSSYGSGVTNTIYLGTTTELNTATLSLAGDRTFGTVTFRPATSGAAITTAVVNPSLKIRAADGTGEAAMSVGSWTGAMPAGSSTSTVDLTGGKVDAKVSTLKVGTSSSGATNTASAILTIDVSTSTFDASGLVTVGETTAGTSGTLNGTLNVKGGAAFTANAMTLGKQASGVTATNGALTVAGTNTSVTLTNNLTMGVRSGTAAVQATVGMTDGTLTVGGNLVEGTGGANITSAVTLSGGTLDMTHGTVTVDTFNFTGGTLKNVATFTGSLSVQNTATLGFDLDGTSPTLILTGLTLGGSSNLGLSLLNDITPSASYTLVSGTISGTFFTINGAAFGDGNTFTLSNNLGTYNGTLTYGANDITLALTAIPEPSACAALAGAMALGAVAWRRKRRASA